VRWRKFYEDVVGVVLLPFIGVAYLLASFGFVALGWVPGVFGFLLSRYSDSEFWKGVASVLISFSWPWLPIFMIDDSEEVKKL